jgi:protein dithiol oxidoreductase (disulfide-forming)
VTELRVRAIGPTLQLGALENFMLKHVLMFAVALFAAGAVSAQEAAKSLEVGKDYFLIDPAVPTDSDKVVVTEVFSYACPHCAHFQPYADQLKSQLPAGVEFNLLPAVFQPGWEPFARAFYTAKSLGLIDKTHQALFDAIHRDHQPLRTLEDLANLFYSNYGANAGSFVSTATSFVIEGELAHGSQLVHDYQVDATPTLIIDGKYRVVANSEKGIGFGEMVPVALQLVKQELATKKPAHDAPKKAKK